MTEPAGEMIATTSFRYDLGLMYHAMLTLHGRTRAVWVVAVACGIGYSIYEGRGDEQFAAWMWVNIVWFLLLCAILYLSPVIRIRKMLKEPNLAGSWTITADNQGLFAKGEQADGTYKWSAFSKFVETPRALVLRLGKAHFVAIPKAAFADESRLKAFASLLKSNIPGNAKKFSGN